MKQVGFRGDRSGHVVFLVGWGRGKFMDLEQKMAVWKWQNRHQYPFFSEEKKRCAERVFSIHTTGPIQIILLSF
jgi:hypothetical protein